jgi:hypothetical protein
VRPKLIHKARKNILLTVTRPITTPTISLTRGPLLFELLVVLFAVVLVLLVFVLAVVRILEVARLTISFPRLNFSGRMCGRSSENIGEEGALGCGNASVMAVKIMRREMREALEVVNFMLTWS